ncbi:MAG: hypothetical protein MAG431_00228 [Chloroflexi bacterium]|nr:hypothetical protein [Chloroflexota bacterium]
MTRTIFRSGNSTVVSLPPEVLDDLGLRIGDEVSVVTDVQHNHIIVQPITSTSREITPALLDEIDQFIDRYRPALDELAKD